MRGQSRLAEGLVWILEQALGDVFTAVIREAWALTCWGLAREMMAAVGV